MPFRLRIFPSGRRKYRSLLAIGIAILLCLFVSFVLMTSNGGPRHVAYIPVVDYQAGDFVSAVAARANRDKFVILALVDEAFVDMAINLYETSFLRNGIENFLFVGIGKSCKILSDLLLPCYHYADDAGSGRASSYNTSEFNRKMNYRTDMILEAIGAGFTVVHTDLDLFYLVDPLPELTAIMHKADIAALWDRSKYNAGFIVIKSSPMARLVYQLTRNITSVDIHTADQDALNMVIDRLRNTSLVVTKLDQIRYACGVIYWEPIKGKPPLSDKGLECDHWLRSDCVTVVHNNWIVSRAAKVYRFREHLMWSYDADGSYYASSSQRYLTFTNPELDKHHRGRVRLKAIAATAKGARADQLPMEPTDFETELSSLKAAMLLGQLLDRVVILPRFHCGPNAHPCTLNALINIKRFDAQFAGRYRESSFLQHPKVPDEVRNDLSPPYAFALKHPEYTTGINKSKKVKYKPVAKQTVKEVQELYGKDTSRVLVFQSLQGAYQQLQHIVDANTSGLLSKFNAGFRLSNYRQYI